MTTPTQTYAYGSPEAKTRIRELQTIERDRLAAIRVLQDEQQKIREAARGRAYTPDEDGRLRELDEDVRILLNERYAANRERISLQTTPLPVAPAALPAQMLSRVEAEQFLTPGPVDPADYQPGDLVVVHSRGAYREAIVVSVGTKRVEIAYTTATALREAADRGRPANPTVTRKNVPTSDLYNHRPAERASTPEEETTMSKDEQTPTKRVRKGRGAAAQTARTRKTAAKNAPAETPAETEIPAVEPETPEVVELPERDTTPADLAASVRVYVEEATEASIEIAAAPHHERWTVTGKTIAYVRIGARGASVEVKTPGETGPGKRTLVRNADEVGPVARELVTVVQSLAAPAAA